jgi:phospholipid/cholesterol/gamma-HCH transport system ATP-binding protein
LTVDESRSRKAEDAHAPASDSDVAPLLEVRDLVKEYPGKRVLDGVCFDCRPGEVVVIMGASGAGKSTIFQCVIGATPITGGNVVIDGEDITRIRDRSEYDRVRKKYGVAFQSGALFNSMTIGENVALPIRYHTKLDEETIRVMVKLKLEQVGLRQAEDLLPSQISGGMQKRAAFARAVALDPKILFFDEPSAGLDPIAVAVIDELILDFSRKMGIACVVITHEIESAFRIADKILILHQGKIVRVGSPEEIRNSDDPLVRQFINGLPDGPIPRTMSETDFLTDIMEG